MRARAVALCVVISTSALVLAAPTTQGIQDFDQGANQLSRREVVPDISGSLAVKAAVQAQETSIVNQRTAELEFAPAYPVPHSQQKSVEDLTGVDHVLQAHAEGGSSEAQGLITRVSELLKSAAYVKDVTQSLPSSVAENIVTPLLVLFNTVGVKENTLFKEGKARRLVVPTLVTYEVRQSIFSELDEIRQNERFWDEIDNYVDTACTRLKRYIGRQRPQIKPTSGSSTTLAPELLRAAVVPKSPKIENSLSTTTTMPASPTVHAVTAPAEGRSDMQSVTFSTTIVPSIASTSQPPITQATAAPDTSFTTLNSVAKLSPKGLKPEASVPELQASAQARAEKVETIDHSQAINQVEQLSGNQKRTQQTVLPTMSEPLSNAQIAAETTSFPEAALKPVVTTNTDLENLHEKPKKPADEDVPVYSAEQLPKRSPVSQGKPTDSLELTPELPTGMAATPEVPVTAVVTKIFAQEVPSTVQPDVSQQIIVPLVPAESSHGPAVAEKPAAAIISGQITIEAAKPPPVTSGIDPTGSPIGSPNDVNASHVPTSHVVSQLDHPTITAKSVNPAIVTSSVPIVSQATSVMSLQEPGSAATVTSHSVGAAANTQTAIPIQPLIASQRESEMTVPGPVVQTFNSLKTLPKQLSGDAAADTVINKPVAAPLSVKGVAPQTETEVPKLEGQKQLI
ncbi:polycystic kidney disease protein 1-like 3 [Varroa destructor]|uniref:Uncharacterized protein n=1 Tax=Varroa destructor TaxID=109461 RepID=A0A7M7KCG1_VARDE|nr:polycystic kidney disease protein 1-like 3 [Varroa destructor]